MILAEGEKIGSFAIVALSGADRMGAATELTEFPAQAKYGQKKENRACWFEATGIGKAGDSQLEFPTRPDRSLPTRAFPSLVLGGVAGNRGLPPCTLV